VWKKLRYPNGKISEDAYVIHDIVRQCRCIVGIDYIGYDYVKRDGSIMSESWKRANFDLYDAWIGRIKYFISINRDDFVREQLSQYIDGLCYQYMPCRTKQEKNIYKEKVQEYSAYAKEFYQEDSVPRKDRVKKLGCKCVPWLFCRCAYIYQDIWKKTWNWRHWEKWR
jgi:hypothetical protein